MMKRSLWFIFCLSLITLIVVTTVSKSEQKDNLDLRTNQKSLQRWQDMKFGMFIHWGPVSLRGTEIGWSRGTQVPVEDYDSLYHEFNPTLFEADEWVRIAKAAGMKYIVITAKHHDGFCLWDSKTTDYDIMSTPFKRDILRELSQACAKYGLAFCTYYSIIDWYHPDYLPRGKGDDRPPELADFEIYKSYMMAQLKEIITTYDPKVLWFDGEWEETWTHRDGIALYKFVRALSPEILINNRVDKGRHGMEGMSRSQDYAGDFGTPEQRIGQFDNEVPWESCITIGSQWAWKPNDTLKSLEECIHTLARTAGGGGNLLLNVGPMLDGRIEKRQSERLANIGKWLQENGESIYSTRGGPYMPTDNYVSTYKENRIYVHLLKISGKTLLLPAITDREIRRSFLLGGDVVEIIQNSKILELLLPTIVETKVCPVIVLELDGPADGIRPISPL